MEHWLPLFHERLVTLPDYLDEGTELGFDHAAGEAIKARAALIGEHYEARRHPPDAGQSFGAAPYRPLPPELLYVDEQSFARTAETRTRWQLSTFGVPPARPSGIDAVREGRAAVQDEGSQLLALALVAAPVTPRADGAPERWLDHHAAGGGVAQG